jgi:hypothetical protein
VRRALRVGGVAVAAALLLARPAAADPPRPTDYRSFVDRVDPASPGVDVEVVGGDSFLQMRVDRGHEVVVEGYQGEPYLRFRSDGGVDRNARSPASYTNESRDGTEVDMPADADSDAEPRWERVAGGGSYAWHDHRIHWMDPNEPEGDPGQVVRRWTVGLTVDGRDTSVRGRLLWVEPVSPWPWAALGLVATAALVVAGTRRSGRWSALVAGPATVVGAALALGVGASQFTDAPAQGAASPLLVAVPVVGLGAALVGVVLRRRRGRTPRVAAASALAASAAVLGWGLLRIDVLWKPVLPTGLAYGLDRAGTTLALALAVAAAVLVVQGGGLAAATVEGETDGDDGSTLGPIPGEGGRTETQRLPNLHQS